MSALPGGGKNPTAIAKPAGSLQSGRMILPTVSRRRRCRAAMPFIATLAVFVALGPASAQNAPAAALPFVLEPIGPGVYAAIDGPEHKAGSNAGFVIGDDGVLVVDSFFNADAARALVAEIHRLTTKPIRYVVNTHYHLDHTGGDQVLRDAGAIIIAHRNVRGWVRTNNVNLFGDRITPALRAQIAALPLPDLDTDKDLVVWLGSRKIVVRTVLGHTGGDLAIFIPNAKVLFCGDLLWRKVTPNLIDGSVREWAATDADFARIPDAAHIRYVPGHGDVADLRDVEDFRAYLLDLQRLVGEGRKAHLTGDALAQAVTPKLKALHPDWTIGDRAAAAEIRYMDQELAGTKRRPVPQPD
jgi:glyoxylase-like metal-dependent hydrolase (beta-lactamase superfamily II)